MFYYLARYKLCSNKISQGHEQLLNGRSNFDITQFVAKEYRIHKYSTFWYAFTVFGHALQCLDGLLH